VSATERGIAAIRNTRKRIAKASPGTVPRVLATEAFRLGKCVTEGDLSEPETRAEVRRLGQQAGISAEQVERIITNSFEKGIVRAKATTERPAERQNGKVPAEAAAKVDTSDAILDDLGIDEASVAARLADKEGDDPQPWDDPVPLEDPAPAPVPVERLPQLLRTVVHAIADAYQVPVELPAIHALGCLSACVVGKAVAQLGPDWTEELAFYGACILPSGERKTAVTVWMRRPIEEYEREAIEESRESVAEGQAAHDILVKRLERAKAEAAKEDDGPDRLAREDAARRLAAEVAKSRPPVLPRFLADDATPEALASLLADHGRLAVISDEGGLFDILAGRYSDRVPNLDIVLKSHTGASHRVDRKGRDSEVIPRPLLALSFAVQPDVVETIRRSPSMRGRGLLARFAYAVPRTALGHRDLEPAPVPERVTGEWRRLLHGLLGIETQYAEDTKSGSEGISARSAYCVLVLDRDARAAFRDFRATVERRLDPDDGDLFGISDWGSKLPGLVARIAGLLHFARHRTGAFDREIGREDIEAACEIGTALIDHARAVLGGGTADLGPARAVLRWIRRNGKPDFSVRDCHTAVRRSDGRLETADGVRAALAVLEERGWTRRSPSPPSASKRGRPSERFEVNPAAWRVSGDGGAA
jgi:hypothetical protein